MLIRFRCRNCQQMLGISHSRAGAVVDCPGCGRTLRVPQSDGTSAPLPNLGHPGDGRDELLRAALSELSMLDPDDVRASYADVLRSEPHAPQHSANIESNPDDIEPTRPSAPHPSTRLESVTPPPKSSGQQSLKSFFEELHPSGHVTPTVPAGTHRPTRPDPKRRTQDEPRNLTRAALAATICAGIFFGGWTVGRSIPESPGHPIVEETSSNPTESDHQELTADPSVENNETNTPLRLSTITGMVEYAGDDGVPKPDSGALVILMPATTSTRLRLDGRELRELEATADQRALRAALQHLGVSFTRADSDGQWQLPRYTNEPQRIVVVSRHRSQADDLPTDREVQVTLEQYFDNVTQFTGRLKSISHAIPAAALNSADVHLDLVVP